MGGVSHIGHIGRVAALPLLVLLLGGGCEGQQLANLVLDPGCNAGVRWAGLEAARGQQDPALWTTQHRGAPEMHPGRDCAACHAKKSGAPALLISGTVFSRVDEVHDCLGVAGAAITVTDANGALHQLRSNSAGNFWLNANEAPNFKMPLQVKIRHGGRNGQMFSSQSNGSCNSCHSAAGTAPAGQSKPPGRVCVDPDDSRCM